MDFGFGLANYEWRIKVEVYTGGAFQGKLEYVLEKKGYGRDSVLEGAVINPLTCTSGYKIINHFHEFIRNYVDKPEEVNEFAEMLVRTRDDIIIITDQVGCGIVPLDRTEREWRELHGRVMCRLASNAKHVERIICGTGQVIK
ncbi:MAG: hypothetical protein HFH67_07670 [Lachnospiraceae bacterium]|nr:hypothetical protein [Lachnospiraceae bacterium]